MRARHGGTVLRYAGDCEMAVQVWDPRGSKIPELAMWMIERCPFLQAKSDADVWAMASPVDEDGWMAVPCSKKYSSVIVEFIDREFVPEIRPHPESRVLQWAGRCRYFGRTVYEEVSADSVVFDDWLSSGLAHDDKASIQVDIMVSSGDVIKGLLRAIAGLEALVGNGSIKKTGGIWSHSWMGKRILPDAMRVVHSLMENGAFPSLS